MTVLTLQHFPHSVCRACLVRSTTRVRNVSLVVTGYHEESPRDGPVF